ncbi:MAG: hypothetical protein COA52_05385 [Hyphomicrobiales bacterium]|nr:MAG: hypothetical protein COA52_05385 [Hyphomicrobiales bacterium]
MRIGIVFTSMLVVAISLANSATAAPRLAELDTTSLYKQIDQWLNNEIVTISINAQNEKYTSLNQEQIIKLDKQWRAEAKQADKPLIAATLSSPLSVYLTRMQGQSYGLFVEIFVVGNKGLNVGQSSVTSDFWQGDEAKFQKTFQVGPTAVFVDEPEWDDTFKIWRVQVNKSLTNPETNQLIGAATIEVNLTELARRQAIAN